MFEDIVSVNNISFLFVFLEGIISFFSPCVIPLIPVYMSYLAGNTKEEYDGVIRYDRKKTFMHTICFVIGISFAYFILGMSFNALRKFFYQNQFIFTKIGGVLIIILGLFQLGIFNLRFLQKERKIHLNLTNRDVNPMIALLMGFTFSFAWTPCIGPALSSVLILASSAKSTFIGNMLVLLYVLGFIIPFLILGLFTTQVLNFLKAKQKLIKYTIKLGGILLIIIGFMTFTGWMNGVSGYLNSFTLQNSKSNEEGNEGNRVKEGNKENEENFLSEDTNGKDSKDKDSKDKDSKDKDSNKNDNIDEDKDDKAKEPLKAFDFTLTDQYGNEHTLSDYKGKVVFINFWATWCPPCRREMPDIEDLYSEYNYNEDEVVILGVANPKTEENPYNREEKKEGVIQYLEENNFTFPVVFDETGDLLRQYYISSFPTTFMIDKEGNIYGYVQGMMEKDIMKRIIEETLESTEDVEQESAEGEVKGSTEGEIIESTEEDIKD